MPSRDEDRGQGKLERLKLVEADWSEKVAD